MPVFFKIAEDGKKVYVAKSVFAKEMSEEEFAKKAKRISVDDFLSKFSVEVGEKLEDTINKVRKINEMNLSKIDIKMLSNPMSRTTRVIYDFGDKKFKNDTGENPEYGEVDEAYEYAKEKYDEKTYEEIVKPYLKNERYNPLHLSGNKVISEEMYNKLITELKNSTKVCNVEKVLNKSNKR